MSSIPAIKARMGKIDYYILSMKAGDLANRTVFPSEKEDWDESVEEIFQREIKHRRAEKQIAPYLVRSEDRFFGSVIMAAENFSDKKFESLEHLADIGTIPLAYRNATKGVGVIQLDDGEVLIPLDGQHRIKAIKYAISGTGEKGQELGFKPDRSLADENVSVILVPYEMKWARKVFIIVNKFAKTTTESEEILTSDEDIIAIITRQIANRVIGAKLVNLKSKSLNAKSTHFTTLVTIYKCTENYIKYRWQENFKKKKLDKTKLPDDEATIRNYERTAKKFWNQMTEGIDKWKLALEGTDDYRIQLRKHNLLGKPIVQLALVNAYLRLLSSGIDHRKACQGLNKVNWAIPENLADRPDWHGVCMSPAHRMTNKMLPLASRIIAYMAGEELNKRRKDDLLQEYKTNHWNPDKSKIQLPPQVDL